MPGVIVRGISILILVPVLFAGCDIIAPCAAPPAGSHGVCDPNQPVCGGGTSTPVEDTRQDGAVDIARFAPGEVPAGVVLSVPNEGRLHVPDDAPLVYAVSPPASGRHFDNPADTGFYCDTLSPGHWVHSLEHGYIVVLFDPAKIDTNLARFFLGPLLHVAPASPTFGNRKLVMTAYSGLPHAICVVSWNRQLFLDDVYWGPVLDFYGKYIDQGPETVP